MRAAPRCCIGCGVALLLTRVVEGSFFSVCSFSVLVTNIATFTVFGGRRPGTATGTIPSSYMFPIALEFFFLTPTSIEDFAFKVSYRGAAAVWYAIGIPDWPLPMF